MKALDDLTAATTRLTVINDTAAAIEAAALATPAAPPVSQP
jgi:hypothetical protein